ncbi:restriction endonuclease [Streptomyces sp. NPDC020807]|uniref:restriction endonuclease n=1 Tax=Streptomyces sp. NPDC020807 TaxID=3155119 RepID=UPI0033E10222
MAWESVLVSEFQRLQSSPDAHRRGRKFEELLERLFQNAHFRVQRNPGTARPRQTDLLASYGDTWYLIEAKWEKAPINVDTFDAVRSRMERAVPSAVGVIISMSGFTDTVIPEVEKFRGKQPILLIGPKDLLQVLRAPESLANLLRIKREELMVHGRVHLSEETTRRARRRSVSDLPAAALTVLGVDQQPLPYVTKEGGFAGLVFAHDLPDVDWVIAGGRGVTLDLPVSRIDERGLIDLVHTLNSMGWTTSQPSWSIRQLNVGWHGTGAREFVGVLAARAERYQDLPEEEVHHSEQVTYFDTCAGGGFYTLSADISTDGSRVTGCNVSFQLVGVPVDVHPLRHLFEQYDAMPVGFFRPLAGASVTRGNLEADEPLQAVGYVVSSDTFPDGALVGDLAGSAAGSDPPERWVTGIVARNPYFKADGALTPEGWPSVLATSEVIVCALRSHHPLTKIPDAYSLVSWERARTSDAEVFRPVADW